MRARTLWFLFALGANAAQAAPAPGLHRQVDALFAPFDGRDRPGCAVGIARDGVLDYAHGYGMAQLEHAIPITPQSVFHTSSIAKQFTAFAIGLLAQDGKLALADDIRNYLPELPDYGTPITIADLVHHTDGLREQGQLLNLAGWRGDDLYTEDDILWVLARQRRLNFAPGAEIVYGNAAYTLLAVIARRVSGQSLQAFAAARIFTPLGMVDTRFRTDHTEVVARRAAAYSPRAGGGWSTSVPNIDHIGSTSLQSTVADLLAWQRNLVTQRLGGPVLGAWMRTAGLLADGTATGYGGGLRVGSYRGLATVGHDGADGGFRSEMLLFPDQGLGIVALCNGATIVPATLVRRIADLYLHASMKEPALAPAAAVPAGAQAWAGVYWSALSDEVVQLEWRDGALRQAGAAAPLVPLGGGLFRPDDQAHAWRFGTSATGAAELRIRDFWPTDRLFTRLSEPLPAAAVLSRFAGRYHSDETDAGYTVHLSGARLTLAWPRGYAVDLTAIGGDRFIGSLGTVTFLRAADGAVTGLMISNRRLRRLVASRVAGS